MQPARPLASTRRIGAPAPDSLLIEEVVYLSYLNRHADLLFALINQRYEKRSALITSNKSLSEWFEVYPNASCAVAMIDRPLGGRDKYAPLYAAKSKMRF